MFYESFLSSFFNDCYLKLYFILCNRYITSFNYNFISSCIK